MKMSSVESLLGNLTDNINESEFVECLNNLQKELKKCKDNDFDKFLGLLREDNNKILRSLSKNHERYELFVTQLESFLERQQSLVPQENSKITDIAKRNERFLMTTGEFEQKKREEIDEKAQDIIKQIREIKNQNGFYSYRMAGYIKYIFEDEEVISRFCDKYGEQIKALLTPAEQQVFIECLKFKTPQNVSDLQLKLKNLTQNRNGDEISTETSKDDVIKHYICHMNGEKLKLMVQNLAEKNNNASESLCNDLKSIIDNVFAENHNIFNKFGIEDKKEICEGIVNGFFNGLSKVNIGKKQRYEIGNGTTYINKEQKNSIIDNLTILYQQKQLEALRENLSEITESYNKLTLTQADQIKEYKQQISDVQSKFQSLLKPSKSKIETPASSPTSSVVIDNRGENQQDEKLDVSELNINDLKRPDANKLDATVNGAVNLIQSQNGEIAGLREQLDKIQQQFDNIRKQLETEQKGRTQAETKLIETQRQFGKQIETEQARISKLEADKVAIQQQIEAEQQKNQLVTNENEELKQKLQEARKANTAQAEDIARMQEEDRESKATIASQTQQLTYLNAHFQGLSQSLNQTLSEKAKVIKLNADQTQHMEEKDKDIVRARDENKKLRSRVNDLQDQVNSLQEDKIRQGVELTSLKAKIVQLEDLNGTLQKQSDNSSRRANSARQKSDELTHTVGNQKIEIENLSKQSLQDRRIIEELQQQLKEQYEALERTKDAQEIQVQQNNKLENTRKANSAMTNAVIKFLSNENDPTNESVSNLITIINDSIVDCDTDVLKLCLNSLKGKTQLHDRFSKITEKLNRIEDIDVNTKLEKLNVIDVFNGELTKSVQAKNKQKKERKAYQDAEEQKFKQAKGEISAAVEEYYENSNQEQENLEAEEKLIESIRKNINNCGASGLNDVLKPLKSISKLKPSQYDKLIKGLNGTTIKETSPEEKARAEGKKSIIQEVVLSLENTKKTEQLQQRDQRINELMEENEKSNTVVANQAQQIDTLKQQLDTEKRQTTNLEADKVIIQNQLGAVRQENDILNQQLQKKEKQVAKLTEAVDKSEKERANVQELYSKSNYQNRRTGREIGYLKQIEKEYKKTLNLIETIRAERDELTAKNTEQSEIIATQRKQLQEREQKVRDQEQALKEANKRLEVQQRQLNEQKKALEQAQNEKKLLEQQLKEQNEALERAQSEKERLEQQLNEQQKEINGLNERLKTSEGQIQELNGKIKGINDEKTKLAQQEKDLQSRIKILTEDLRNKQGKINDLKNENAGKGSTLVTQQQELTDLRKQLDEIQQKQRKKEEENQGLLEKKIKLEQEKKEFETQLREKERQINVLKNQNAAQGQQVTDLQKNIDSLERENSKLSNYNVAMMATLMSQGAQYQKKEHQLRQEIKQLQDQLTEQDNIYQKKIEEQRRLATENAATLAEKKQTYEQETAELRQQYGQQVEQLRQQIISKQKSLNDNASLQSYLNSQIKELQKSLIMEIRKREQLQAEHEAQEKTYKQEISERDAEITELQKQFKTFKEKQEQLKKKRRKVIKIVKKIKRKKKPAVESNKVQQKQNSQIETEKAAKTIELKIGDDQFSVELSDIKLDSEELNGKDLAKSFKGVFGDKPVEVADIFEEANNCVKENNKDGLKTLYGILNGLSGKNDGLKKAIGSNDDTLNGLKSLSENLFKKDKNLYSKFSKVVLGKFSEVGKIRDIIIDGFSIDHIAISQTTQVNTEVQTAENRAQMESVTPPASNKSEVSELQAVRMQRDEDIVKKSGEGEEDQLKQSVPMEQPARKAAVLDMDASKIVNAQGKNRQQNSTAQGLSEQLKQVFDKTTQTEIPNVVYYKCIQKKEGKEEDIGLKTELEKGDVEGITFPIELRIEGEKATLGEVVAYAKGVLESIGEKVNSDNIMKMLDLQGRGIDKDQLVKAQDAIAKEIEKFAGNKWNGLTEEQLKKEAIGNPGYNQVVERIAKKAEQLTELNSGKLGARVTDIVRRQPTSHQRV